MQTTPDLQWQWSAANGLLSFWLRRGTALQAQRLDAGGSVWKLAVFRDGDLAYHDRVFRGDQERAKAVLLGIWAMLDG